MISANRTQFPEGFQQQVVSDLGAGKRTRKHGTGVDSFPYIIANVGFPKLFDLTAIPLCGFEQFVQCRCVYNFLFFHDHSSMMMVMM